MVQSLRTHWPEYLIEALLLGFFMVSASVFGTLIWHPDLPIYHLLGTEVARRMGMGMAMGITAVLLIYSPWGKRSGAHMNPAVTITMLVLGKIRRQDAAFYVIAQFLGGTLAVVGTAHLMNAMLDPPRLWFVPTVPGAAGVGVALVAELAMSAFMMTVVVVAAEFERVSAWTGVLAGATLMTFIVVAAPLSGVGINPARTVASAVPSHIWSAWWIYLVGPIAGMVLAGVGARAVLRRNVNCGGLHPDASSGRVQQLARRAE